MVFFFGLITGVLAAFSFAAVACIFIIDNSDDESKEMESFYNYRKDD